MKSLNALPLTVFIIAVLTSAVHAQSDKEITLNKNAIYADFGFLGLGAVGTISYERRLWINKAESFQTRVRTGYGFGGIAAYYSSAVVNGVPINITALFGKKEHFFEITAGVIIGTKKSQIYPEPATKSFGLWPLIDIGYRYEKLPKGIILRAKIGTGGIGGGIGFGF